MLKLPSMAVTKPSKDTLTLPLREYSGSKYVPTQRRTRRRGFSTYKGSYRTTRQNHLGSVKSSSSMKLGSTLISRVQTTHDGREENNQ